MKIVSISDTHNRMDITKIPDGDLLIHAGDATNSGSVEELSYFFDIFCSLPHKHKIFVPGNHDILMEQDTSLALVLWKMRAKKNDHVLINSSVMIEGLKVFGFPYVPIINGRWVFEKNSADLQRKVNRIPEDVDILVSHSPAYGILDVFPDSLGIEHSYGIKAFDGNFFRKMKNLKLFVCGHIHESFGEQEFNGITFQNVAHSQAIIKNGVVKYLEPRFAKTKILL
jgi:Icc-related predicted phosphoesterase